MNRPTRIVALGQSAARDDGVGIAVLDELERRGVPRGVELLHLADPMGLVSLLETAEARVVLVDAILAPPPGVVLELDPDELSSQASQAASSHGLGAARAIELARALWPSAARHLRVVAITIARPDRYGVGLSRDVAAAVPRAADHVLQLLGG